MLLLLSVNIGRWGSGKQLPSFMNSAARKCVRHRQSQEEPGETQGSVWLCSRPEDTSLPEGGTKQWPSLRGSLRTKHQNSRSQSGLCARGLTGEDGKGTASPTFLCASGNMRGHTPATHQQSGRLPTPLSVGASDPPALSRRAQRLRPVLMTLWPPDSALHCHFLKGPDTQGNH